MVKELTKILSLCVVGLGSKSFPLFIYDGDALLVYLLLLLGLGSGFSPWGPCGVQYLLSLSLPGVWGSDH